MREKYNVFTPNPDAGQMFDEEKARKSSIVYVLFDDSHDILGIYKDGKKAYDEAWDIDGSVEMWRLEE